MDKPTEQPELDCGITISTITDVDIETVETTSGEVELKLKILMVVISLL